MQQSSGETLIAGAWTRDGASLRDPAGFVFEAEGRIGRFLQGQAAADWLAFARTDLAERLFAEGKLIPTEPGGQGEGFPPGSLVLRHQRVEIITYPLEWSFSMLRDCALLHLELMEALVPAGWALKDANPTNVQFVNGRPCLIDVASIAPCRSGVWLAYGQFCRTMLFPLLAAAYGGHSLQALVKGFGREGLDAAATSRLLRGGQVFRPGVLMHVHLQKWMQGLGDRLRLSGSEVVKSARPSTSAILGLVKGLRRALEALPVPRRTLWTDYRFTSTYTEEQMRGKQALVDRWAREGLAAGDTVLDVGCNTGDYSRQLARHAGAVVAIDADMACIDALYRDHPDRILPLVVDIADPTPAAGWALAEQRSFPSRVRPDWSIWLAVIHHLAIHNGIRLDETVRRMVATSPNLIVEFVAPEDSMVQVLLAERGIERPDYGISQFEGLLADLGVEVLATETVTPTRQLYLLRSGRTPSGSGPVTG